MKKQTIAATAAVAMSVLALSGCSGKLSTQETCDLLISKGQEMNISAAVADMVESANNSDPVGAKMAAESVKGWMDEAANETADKDFEAALRFNADNLDELLDVQLDSSLSDDSKRQKSEELASSQHQEFLGNACPQMGSLFG